MGSKSDRQLHFFFFAFMSQGHMIPFIDMAKLFAHRGFKATIITTPLNAHLFANTVQINQNAGLHLHVHTLDFPCAAAGLPDGCENLDIITSSQQPNLDLFTKFHEAAAMLQEPLEKLLQELQPDCLVADTFFPWTTDAAAKFGIPRLVSQGMSFFSMCAMECMRLHEPYKKVESDSEPFVVPDLPGDIKLTKKQLPDSMFQETETAFMKMIRASNESELRSYGAVVNSFYELESMYVDYYRKVLGRRVWHIGPVSLCNRAAEDKANRGKKASINEHECLKWLDSKEPDSVIYLCFGSTANFTGAQLKEIALGLEASGQNFIWVVRRDKEEKEDWLPEGFEQRTEGKGLIIRGWAPQVLILDHQAVGAFVTHCGWNSTLESISAGVPMVAWPIAAKQFYNEKLLTQILGTAISVGVKQWVRRTGDFVRREQVEKAVTEIMVGEMAGEMRRRAKELAEMAKRAVEKDGSSDLELNSLLEELSLRCR